MLLLISFLKFMIKFFLCEKSQLKRKIEAVLRLQCRSQKHLGRSKAFMKRFLKTKLQKH